MAAPNYILIGAQKGGTRSAVTHFNMHPEVFMHEKELHFFNQKYENGIASYELNFNDTDKPIRGEKTPIYYCNFSAMERIKKHYPDVKLILLLREPISRMYSQWNHFHTLDSFSQFRISPNLKFKIGVGRGKYIKWIEGILNLFPMENLYIAISEEVLANPLEEYNKMFQFIGARQLSKQEFAFQPNVHRRKYKTKIDQKDFNYLYEIYKPYNSLLYGFIGRRIESWENIYKKIHR